VIKIVPKIQKFILFLLKGLNLSIQVCSFAWDTVQMPQANNGIHFSSFYLLYLINCLLHFLYTNTISIKLKYLSNFITSLIEIYSKILLIEVLETV
jgi:hypothetical protein